jgi:hypothetical protein
MAEEPAASQAEEEATKQLLHGTTWSIEWTPMSGETRAQPFTDTLSFENGQITSQRLSAEGYPSSNYTFTIGDDDIPVWETMQTSEGSGVVFWRGEVHGEAMRGIVSQHPVEGAAQDFSFAGKLTKREATPVQAELKPPGASQPSGSVLLVPLEPAIPPPSTPSAQATESTSSPPAPKAPAKKKRGWFR